MKTENPVILADLADDLGKLKALAADVDSQIEILKGELILAGVPAIDGQLFRVTVSHCPGRDVTDWKALALDLMSKLNEDQLARVVSRFTTTGTPYSVVRVSARKG